jgi:hypothetical protein
MPARRELTMRQLRQMLRLHHEGVSAREIGRTLGVPHVHERFGGESFHIVETFPRRILYQLAAESTPPHGSQRQKLSPQ